MFKTLMFLESPKAKQPSDIWPKNGTNKSFEFSSDQAKTIRLS